jgi:hypothetical protein
MACYDACVTEMKNHEKEFSGTQEVKETKGKPLFKPMNLKADKRDLKKIKELPKINKDIKKAAAGKGYNVGKANESYVFSSKILPFDQFSVNLAT